MIHRALKTIKISSYSKLFNLGLFIFCFSLMFFLNRNIFEFWNFLTNHLLSFLDLPYEVTKVSNAYPLRAVTYAQLNDKYPGGIDILIGFLVCLILIFGLKFILKRDFWLPFKYFCKFLGFLLLLSIIYFLLIPASFPYSLHYYSKDFYNFSFLLMCIVSIVHLMTFYLLSQNYVHKIIFTLASQIFILLWTPLILSIHIYIIYKFSLLYMPILFIVFGILLDILFFIAIFGYFCSLIHQTNPCDSILDPKTE